MDLTGSELNSFVKEQQDEWSSRRKTKKARGRREKERERPREREVKYQHKSCSNGYCTRVAKQRYRRCWLWRKISTKIHLLIFEADDENQFLKEQIFVEGYVAWKSSFGWLRLALVWPSQDCQQSNGDHSNAYSTGNTVNVAYVTRQVEALWEEDDVPKSNSTILQAFTVKKIQLERGAREETGRFKDVKRCVATGDRTRVSGIISVVWMPWERELSDSSCNQDIKPV